MQDNQFVGSIPESFGNLTNLTHLYVVYYNYIYIYIY